MKQRIADALQVLGAVSLVTAAALVGVGLALLVGGTLAIAAGVLMERG